MLTQEPVVTTRRHNTATETKLQWLLCVAWYSTRPTTENEMWRLNAEVAVAAERLRPPRSPAHCRAAVRSL